ncbi:TAXI family TRAP transporter solute-binding subunit [Sodalis glossinidius]|uniref:TAXI family TRAP transporter solute-binding subunit n=1 Tax=Sodalis glossinidius TaxID=63612 RepID=UPI000302D10F|nr:TAXI family TRAP transporter solute-binding subunit [Sodalis glossinidius]
MAASEKGLFGALLVAKNSPITTVEQLKGKKIAVYRDSGFHNSLLSILRDHGLSVDDVQLRYLAPAEGLAALTQGRVDAWGIWDLTRPSPRKPSAPAFWRYRVLQPRFTVCLAENPGG